MVPLEARKYVPVPMSEVSLDWSVIPKPALDVPTVTAFDLADTKKSLLASPRKKSEVMLVAIHNDVLEQYQAVLKQTGFRAPFFELETFSALRSITSGDLAPVVIVDCGAGTTKVTIVDYGSVHVSHTINKGAQDITTAISRSLSVDFAKAEEIKRRVGIVEPVFGVEMAGTVSPILEYIFIEVNRTITDYQKRATRAVSKVIFIGSGVLLKGFAEVAKKNFEIPISIGNGFAKVETPVFLGEVIGEVGPAFAISTGLALRGLAEL